MGLTGNLRGVPVHRLRGRTVTGAQVDYNGSPAGYTAAPGEAVTYVDAHDNEILYDALAFKLPAGTPAADRARMQVLALATTVLGQGAGFVTAGSDLLRSKSLDRNSYNSGDWFNAIRWDCAQRQRLRPRPAAGGRQRRASGRTPSRCWPTRRWCPDCAAIDLATPTGTQELLRVAPVVAGVRACRRRPRCSSGCRSRWPGRPRRPGVITMTLDARGVDRRWRSIVVVFNATPDGADAARRRPGRRPGRAAPGAGEGRRPGGARGRRFDGGHVHRCRRGRWRSSSKARPFSRADSAATLEGR